MSFKEQLKQLLIKVASKDVNNWFAQPVKVEEVPLYYEYIKSPMDFATMKQKLNSNAYHSVDDMSKDFDLIWTNCMIFNGDDTPFFKEAQRLKRITKPIVDSYRKKVKTSKSSKSSDISESSLSTIGSSNRITLKFSTSSNSLASDDGDVSRSQTTSSPRLISASASPSGPKKPVYRFAMIPPPFRSTTSLVSHTQLAEGSIACLAELARIERSLADITDKKTANTASLPPGPMLYNEYRPLAQVPFDSRYVDRVARYSLGPDKKADQLSRFLYHQKMDNIITDPNSMPIFKPSHDWKPQEAFLENVDSFRDHFNPAEPYGMSAKQLISIQNLLQKAATHVKSEASDDTIMKVDNDEQSTNKSNDHSNNKPIKQENIHVKTESASATKTVSTLSTGARLVQVKVTVSASGSITTTILPANNWSSVTSSAPITVLDNAAAVVRLISNWQKTKHIKPEQPSTPQHNPNQQVNANRTAPVSYPVPAAQHTGSHSVPSTPLSHSSAASSPGGSEKSQAKKERQRARELEKEKEREKLKEKERKKQEKERKRAKRKLEEQQQAAQQKPDLKPIIVSQSSPSSLEADNEQAAKRRRLDDGRIAHQPHQQQMHPVMSQYQQRPGMPGPANTINTMQMHPQQYAQHHAPMGVQQATPSATNAISAEVRLAYTIYANSVKNGKPMTGLQITDALVREGKNISLRDAQIAVAQLTAILQQREKTRQALAQQSVVQPQQQVHQQVQSSHQQVQSSSHQQAQPAHQQMQSSHQQVQPVHQQVQSSHQQIQPSHQQVQPTHQQIQSTNQQIQPIHVQPTQQPTHSQPIVVQSTHSQPAQMHSSQMQGALQTQTPQAAHHQHSSQHQGQTLHPQAFQLMQGQSAANPMSTSSPPVAAMQTNDPQQNFRNNLSRLAQQAKSLLPDSIANSYITSLNELQELTDVNHHQMLLQTKYNQLKLLVNQTAAARQAGQQPASVQQAHAHPVHQQQVQQHR